MSDTVEPLSSSAEVDKERRGKRRRRRDVVMNVDAPEVQIDSIEIEVNSKL